MRRFALAAVASAEEPISAVNTTPLIDVMLVLLIMFILSIPAATHKVPIDLPNGPKAPALPPVVHQIDLAASGAIAWDGAPVAETVLPGRLAAFRKAQPDGVLELRSDGAARYETFDRLLATIKRSGIARLAFVGNERFANE